MAHLPQLRLLILLEKWRNHNFSIARPLKSLSPFLNNVSKVEVKSDLPKRLGLAKKNLPSFSANLQTISVLST